MSIPAIVLFTPDIPQNTGNIIRLCANTGAELHLVRPLGFPLDDKKLRRSGLDYHEFAHIIVHDDWLQCKGFFGQRRLIAIETDAKQYYNEVNYTSTDVLIFGSETKGLPAFILDDVAIKAAIPMQPGQRSLNLSNAAALVIYESWRQLNFVGGK